MTFLGRTPRSYFQNMLQMHKYLWYCLKCFFLFKDPLFVIYHYFTSRPPTKQKIQLRSGLTIFLSDHPADLITVFLVFVKEDYGRFRRGGNVIDVGANIGVFSLYAAYLGASRVYSYEPNSQAFRMLQRNIAANRLESVVIPRQLFVTERANDVVRFPVHVSPYNTSLIDDRTDDYESVTTTDIPSIIKDNDIDNVELLKLDCEGSEYDIIPSVPEFAWSKIDNLRMEFHRGNSDLIIDTLSKYHLMLRMIRHDAPSTGNMWFGRG